MKAHAMTRSSKRNAKMAAASCLFALLYALSFLADGRKPQTVTSALLNQSYAKKITRVELSAATGEAAVLEKTASFWTHEQDGLCVPVRSEYIDSLLGDAARVRLMTVIAGKKANYAAYGLDEDSAFFLAFIDNEGKTAAELYFGADDYTGQRVAVRSSAGPAIYWTEKEISLRLTAAREYWADTHVIPQFMAGEKWTEEAATIQKITLALNQETTRVLNAPKENYSALASLRASRVVPRQPSDAAIVALMRVEFSDGAALELRITSLGGEGGEFAAVPAFTQSGVFHSGAELARLNYSFVISAWTYNRLKDLCAR